ncbi:MAG: hypothetical protein IPK87_02010 [Planctomycetes bacterium]|nr:hypothetical protein [Planctomycetota bacterium]
MPPSLAPAWKEHDEFARRLPASVLATLGGAFTPRALALRAAHETLSKFPKDHTPVLLDPACGLGSLLLGAIEWASVQRPMWIKGWLAQGRLQGWEVSREIGGGCKRVITAAGKCLGGEARPKVLTTDALMSDEREIADAILMFPPWVEFTAQSGNVLPPDKRAWFARKFGSFASFPGLHGAFAELAGRLVKRSGRVGALLPYKVADRPEYAGFRRALANLLAPDQILTQSDLPGVSEPAALFIFTAGKGDVSGEPWQARADEQEQVYQSSILRHGPLPAGTFQDIGVNFGNSAHLLITDKGEPGAQPLRDSNDVIPFGIRKPQLYLRGKVQKITGFYAKIPSPAVFKRVKIVLRRDGGRPAAARHNPPAFFRDDLIGCFGAQGYDDDYLLGVFNSEYYARLYRDSFKEGRLRAEGRITVEQLSVLPVPSPRAAGKMYEAIIQISRELQKVAGKNAKLMATRDEAVKKAYRGKG